MAKINLKARHKARVLAMQAIYEWQLSKNPMDEIKKRLLVENPKVDVEFFEDTLSQISADVNPLDILFTPYLDRAMDELSSIELAILRLGTFELTKRLDIPYRVVINEGIELAKKFGAQDSHRYINGVLDKVAHQTRQMEIAP